MTLNEGLFNICLGVMKGSGLILLRTVFQVVQLESLSHPDLRKTKTLYVSHLVSVKPKVTKHTFTVTTCVKDTLFWTVLSRGCAPGNQPSAAATESPSVDPDPPAFRWTSAQLGKPDQKTASRTLGRLLRSF